MEEIVMALKVREDYWDYCTEIKTEEIYNTSRMVSNYTGMLVQPNKAIIGENAFAHESGIHQDGVLKRRDTYEIMTPESVGLPANKIVLGRHSGRHGLTSRLHDLGYEVSEEKIKQIYPCFLELADKKKEIFDEDLRVLMGDDAENEPECYGLEYLHVNLGTTTIPTATVRIKIKDKVFEESATGDGPVAACFRAIKRAIGFGNEVKLEHYQVQSMTSGKGALGEVILRLRINDNEYTGKGISTDTIEASSKAYLDALNHFEKFKDLQPVLDGITAI
jgi:2-isopropylmalate synthase